MSIRSGAVFHNVKVDKLVFQGWGLASLNGLKVFIPNTLPEDVVSIMITQKKRDYAMARYTHIERSSPLRQESQCPHFPVCGGCQMIDVAYANQLRIKNDLLQDCSNRFFPALSHIIAPILSSRVTSFYRNKMEFAFGYDDNGALALGLKKRGKYDDIVAVNSCYLQSPQSNDILSFTARFFGNHSVTAWNYTTNEGVLRHMIIRHSKTTDTYLLNLIVSQTDLPLLRSFAEAVTGAFSNISAVLASLYSGQGESVDSASSILLKGSPYLYEHIGHVNFRISPFSFFQTNPVQTEVLYNEVKKAASLSGRETVLDLYCGTGTIGLYLADKASYVIGIDESASSIGDARINAQENNIKNAEFEVGRVKNILKWRKFKADRIVIDPPRSGMIPKAIQRMLAIGAPVIVYVSCNPATLMRDLNEICASGYAVETFQPVDMFPNTFHVESVVKLVRTR